MTCYVAGLIIFLVSDNGAVGQQENGADILRRRVG